MYRYIDSQERDGYFRDGDGKKRKEVGWLTPWSILHFVTGYFMGSVGIGLGCSFFLHVLYSATNWLTDFPKYWWGEGGSMYDNYHGPSEERALMNSVFMTVGWFMTDVLGENTAARALVGALLASCVFVFSMDRFQKKIIEKRKKYFSDVYSVEIESDIESGIESDRKNYVKKIYKKMIPAILAGVVVFFLIVFRFFQKFTHDDPRSMPVGIVADTGDDVIPEILEIEEIEEIVTMTPHHDV